MRDLDAHIVDRIEQGLGGGVPALDQFVLIEEDGVFVLHLLHGQVLPLREGLVQLVNDGVDDLLGGFGEVADVVEEALTQRHAVLQVLIGRHQVPPVILELQVPGTLLLVLLLLLEFLGRLEVPLNVGLGLIDVLACLPRPSESGTPVLLVLLGLPSQPVSVIIDIAFGIEVDLIDFEVLLEDLVEVGEV